MHWEKRVWLDSGRTFIPAPGYSSGSRTVKYSVICRNCVLKSVLSNETAKSEPKWKWYGSRRNAIKDWAESRQNGAELRCLMKSLKSSFYNNNNNNNNTRFALDAQRPSVGHEWPNTTMIHSCDIARWWFFIRQNNDHSHECRRVRREINVISVHYRSGLYLKNSIFSIFSVYILRQRVLQQRVSRVNRISHYYANRRSNASSCFEY